MPLAAGVGSLRGGGAARQLQPRRGRVGAHRRAPSANRSGNWRIGSGVLLFERQNRRVILTAAGLAFRGSAQDMLQRVATATHAVMASAGSESTLSVAVLPTFAMRWLIPRLPGFLDRNPRHRHRPCRPGLNRSISKRPGSTSPSIMGVPLGPARRCCICSMKWSCRWRAPAIRADCACNGRKTSSAPTCCSLPQGHGYGANGSKPPAWSVPSRCAGRFFDQFSFTAAAATASLGVALVPRFLIEEELAARKVIILFNQGMPGPGRVLRRDPLVQAASAGRRELPPTGSTARQSEAGAAMARPSDAYKDQELLDLLRSNGRAPLTELARGPRRVARHGASAHRTPWSVTASSRATRSRRAMQRS